MTMRIEYHCVGCGGRSSVWTEPPAPERSVCPACREDALPVYGAGVLFGGAPAASADTPAHGCRESFAVPAACVLTPSAARRWSALLRGDDRAYDQEAAAQERAVGEGWMRAGEVLGHGHAAGRDGHAHDHADSAPHHHPA